ncbi:MAG TPA: hypothetical protein VMT00_04050 [Thermoanaerobaculia bacterium]|nr:hypothetical protein [Thermoanaerobaculia bacterium]
MTAHALAAERFDLTLFDRLDSESDELEEILAQHAHDLITAFERSAEAGSMQDPETTYWIEDAIVFAYEYFDATPASIDADRFAALLCDVFPRKITIERAEQAAAVIPALQAFWKWLGREYKLANAPAVLDLLEVLEEDYREIMNDESSFGPGKAFITAGIRAGYDMTDQAQAEEFMLLYKAALRQDEVWLPADEPWSSSSTPEKKTNRRSSKDKIARRASRARK